MVASGSQALLGDAEYDVIEAAVTETERGRRFLAEFARRHRGADTDTLLAAIARLENAVTKDPAVPHGSGDLPEDLRGDLAAMAESIARTRAEIAALRAPDAVEEGAAAAVTLETMVRAAERATCDILAAAEAMQEAAWGLRETGTGSALCDVLDRRAIEIYGACSSQDLSAQRTGRVVATLCDLEARIAGLVGGGPAAESAAPEHHDRAPPAPLPAALPPEDELDFVQSRTEPDPPPVGPLPRTELAEADGTDELALAFADLDRLSIEEKIALFS